MKKALLGLSLATALTCPALADNSTVEDALKSRSDLSMFYQAMMNTGVIHELSEGSSYTIFAPTNDAFAQISAVDYPCFYDAACVREVADVVRNHIVPGEVHLTDASDSGQKGGLYSIDNRFIAVSGPSLDHNMVDGHYVVSTSQLAGNILYKIDGVIADERELAAFIYPSYAYAPVTYVGGMGGPYIPAEEVTTTVTKKVRPLTMPIPAE